MNFNHQKTKISMKTQSPIAFSSFSMTLMYLPFFWLFTWFIKYRRTNVDKSHRKFEAVFILLLSTIQDSRLKYKKMSMIHAMQSVLDEKNFRWCSKCSKHMPYAVHTNSENERWQPLKQAVR